MDPRFPPNRSFGSHYPPPYPGRGGTPPRKTRRGLWLALGGVVMLALGAITAVVCGGDDSGPAPATPVRSAENTEPVLHGPPDRDPAAVVAALRGIDACALFDVNAARSGVNPRAVTMPSGPHACLLAVDEKWTPAYPSRLTIEVGADDDADFRYLEKVLTVGGAKGYEYSDDETRRECLVDLPVSFSLSVRLDLEAEVAKDVRYDACVVVEHYAASVVARLSTSEGRTNLGQRFFAAWDGCSFLARLLAADAGAYTFEANGHDDPFSGCKTTGTNRSPGPELEVTYSKWYAEPGERPTRIAGKAAMINSGARCEIRWNQGTTGNANEWFGSVIFALKADDCATTQRLATEAIALAGGAPDDGGTKAQRPLLYAPGENDTGKVGPCVDLILPDCVPYDGGLAVPPGFEAAANASSRTRAV